MSKWHRGSITAAPEYALVRDEIIADDVIATEVKEHGIQTATYAKAHVQINPSGGANPTATVYWWSEAFGKWVQEHTPLVFAGVGANTAYEFTVECQERLMFVAVTSVGVGAVGIAVSGSREVIQPVA
jgi:hypothetical protein